MAPKPKPNVEMFSQKNSQAAVQVPPEKEASRASMMPKPDTTGEAGEKKKARFAKPKPTKVRISLPKISAYETELEFQ